MQAIRIKKKVSCDRKITIDIPTQFGSEIELIILPVDDYKDKEGMAKLQDFEKMTTDQKLTIASYNAVIEEDEDEDKVWEKYLP
jgi:hypothetical protein